MTQDQPEEGQSGTTAAGDALAHEDSEEQTSDTLGYSLLPLQKWVLVDLVPSRAPRQALGQGSRRKHCNGTATDLRTWNKQSPDRREEQHLQYPMGDGCTPQSWPAGRVKPCALPNIPMVYISTLNPAHQRLLPPTPRKRGAMESSSSHLAGPKCHQPSQGGQSSRKTKEKPFVRSCSRGSSVTSDAPPPR